MKKQVFWFAILASIFAALLFSDAAQGEEAKKTVKIFLLGGQSNMVGSGNCAELKPPYSEPQPKVNFWNRREKKWVPLAAGIESGGKRFGPEVAFGNAIEKVLSDEKVYLVKYAAGGTALYNDWAPTKGGQYVQFMKTAKEALANLDDAGIKYEIVGMLWLQGESDAAEKHAESYEKNLTAFIAHMREQFKTPEMPFIIARVLNHYGGKSGQAKIVRDAQDKIASTDKNVACFATDDCPIVDPVKNRGHYNAAGLVTIGQRFAEGYKETKGKAEKK